jgi:hypothetical protein
MQRLLLAFLTLSLVACAVQKSGEPAQAPGEPPPPVPGASQPQQQGYPSTPGAPGNVLRGEDGDNFASVEDAERELERARRELVGVVSDKKNRREPKASEQPAPMANGDSECGNACKAFASLRRAANGVCRLTNEADARCVRARSVVKENETRVTACGCEPPKD